MMAHYRKKSIPTQNNEDFGILSALKPADIKPSKVQTHNFDVSFLKTSKTGDEAKQL